MAVTQIHLLTSMEMGELGSRIFLFCCSTGQGSICYLGRAADFQFQRFALGRGKSGTKFTIVATLVCSFFPVGSELGLLTARYSQILPAGSNHG